VGIEKAAFGFRPTVILTVNRSSFFGIGRIGRQGLADFPICTE